MKNILLAITGASPQVVTETLYALHTEGKTFPDEMYIITTLGSKQMLCEGFFENGHLAALYKDYDMPALKFDESHIWLIEDEKGSPIDDAKSIEDQTFMADFITRKVFELTEQNNTAIHASIAGGRKTMAFYLGYAMSLLGREQDSLSHVFVNDEFEFVSDFYYPTPYSHVIEGKKGAFIDCQKAQVTLAEIPFVRMRQSIDQTLVNTMQNASFSQTVASLNSAHKQDLILQINPKAKTLVFAGVTIKLTSKLISFYLWLMQHTQSDNKGLLVDRYFEETSQHAIDYLTILQQNRGDLRIYKTTFDIEPEDFREGKYSNLKLMEKPFVQQNTSRIKSDIKKILPGELAERISVDSVKEGNQTRYFVSAVVNNIKIVVID